MVATTEHGFKIYLDPPWENATHKAVKEVLKGKLGAKWDKDAAVWLVGASALLLDFWVLDVDTVTITEAAWRRLQKTQRRQRLSDAVEASSESVKQKIDALLPSVKRLYPFQYAAVEFIVRAGGRALVSEEMGLGKTVETIGYLALRPNLRPGVLVVPAVVTGNWMNELAAWLPGERAQWLQTGKTELNVHASLYVVTYDLLKKRLAELKAQKPKLLVGDEIQMIRNNKSARGKAFIELAEYGSIESFIGLSGTPVINRPLEFYTFLNLLAPTEFNDWFYYTKQYCDGRHEEIYIPGGHGEKKKVWVAKGVSNAEELNQRLKSLMIRRRKEDVLTELPAKTYQQVPVQMKPVERRQYKATVREAKPDGPLAQVTAARQAAGSIKIRAAVDWIQQYHETATPVLVFAHHQAVLDGLQAGAEKLGVRWGRVDGSVPQKRRTALVQQFQDGKLDCMLLSTKAAGIGITLTRASDVLMVEQQWTPTEMNQAVDRCHRIGQTGAVVVRTLVLEDTVDEDMAELLQEKQKMLSAVLDGKELEGDVQLDIRGTLVERWEAMRR